MAQLSETLEPLTHCGWAHLCENYKHFAPADGSSSQGCPGTRRQATNLAGKKHLAEIKCNLEKYTAYQITGMNLAGCPACITSLEV